MTTTKPNRRRRGEPESLRRHRNAFNAIAAAAPADLEYVTAHGRGRMIGKLAVNEQARRAAVKAARVVPTSRLQADAAGGSTIARAELQRRKSLLPAPGGAQPGM